MKFTEKQKEKVRLKIENNTAMCPMSGCWLWTGGYSIKKNNKIFHRAYGSIFIHPKMISTHRAAYATFRGPIPKDKIVLHKCNTSLCVNPQHLELGTFRENNLDKVKAGRDLNSSKIHCKNGHEFNLANTRLWVGPRYKMRKCRQCAHEWNKSKYTKIKRAQALSKE